MGTILWKQPCLAPFLLYTGFMPDDSMNVQAIAPCCTGVGRKLGGVSLSK